MMKIDLLKKEYTGLHIYTTKFCSHIVQYYSINAQIPPVYRNNKQQTYYHIFRGKMTFSLFPNKLVFSENPMYTIQIVPYVR
jgi:hypothetical protein